MNKIYIFVRGGVVQGVRAVEDCDVTVVDYDEYEGHSMDEVVERKAMGCTFEGIEATTRGVW